MIEETTLGGDKVLTSYAEVRRRARTGEAIARRIRQLRAEHYAARGEVEGADPFACFDER